jgi:DEAD/DEAH box helicase domain-containing protein
LDARFSEPYLTGWLAAATSLRNAFADSFGCTPRNFGPLPGLIAGNKVVVVSHPLWDRNRPFGWLAEALADAPQGETVRVINTFNLLRRPSWVYQRLA